MGFLDHKAIGMVEAEEPLELCTACTTIMAKRKGDTFSRVDEIMKKHRADKGRVDEIMKKYRADKEEEKVEQEKYEKEQEKYEKEDKELQEELDALRRIIEEGKEDDEEEEEKEEKEKEKEKEEEKEDDEEEKEGEAASTPETHIKYSPQSPEFL